MPLHRRNDTAPFAGGDDLSELCTGGFPVERNGTSNVYMETAGHCGTGTWKIDSTGTVMGTALSSDQYYNDGSHDDFELIGTNAGDLVWGGSASTPVLDILTGGPYLPPNQSPIAWDGAFTREVRNVPLVAQGICKVDGTEQVCELIKSSQSFVGSQGGDSGGPVFQHTCQTCTTIRPIATIVGKDPNNGPYVYAQYVGIQLLASNTHIDD